MCFRSYYSPVLTIRIEFMRETNIYFININIAQKLKKIKKNFYRIEKRIELDNKRVLSTLSKIDKGNKNE